MEDTTRDRLLSAAKKQFAEKGFYGASIAQVAGEARAGGRLDALPRQRAQHYQPGAWRTAPALLRRADQDVHPAETHVHPQIAGGYAIQHEKPAHGMNGVGDGANDLAMLGAAGLGAAYRAKPAVRAAARFQEVSLPNSSASAS